MNKNPNRFYIEITCVEELEDYEWGEALMILAFALSRSELNPKLVPLLMEYSETVLTEE